jgi:transcriptional regulator with XRE-family HTH domain
MKIANAMADGLILGEVGSRLAGARVERRLTQAELAAEAGVSKRTVERLESGEVGARLTAFVRVLRALGALERLDALVPEQEASPLEQLKLRGKIRKRVSRRGRAAGGSKPWRWGDEK